MKYGYEDLDIWDVVNNNNEIDDQLPFYQPSKFSYESRHYIFVDWHEDTHATNNTRSIDKTWILLDSQSTVDLFCNRRLLINIREVSDRLIVRCNAGKISTQLMGDLPGYGTV